MDAISASVLDQYQTAYDQASAQYNQALAAQQAQENQLSYTQLTADADGVISAVSAEVGQVVAAGQTVNNSGPFRGPGSPGQCTGK